MNYVESDIESLFQESLQQAHAALAALPVADGREPAIGQLTGWVFEQVIRHCLLEELARRDLEVRERVSVGGRAMVDLLVGRAAIEVRAFGSFGAGEEKYARYRIAVERRGWRYLYLTRREAGTFYRVRAQEVFGAGRAFFLDTAGEWRRFVGEVSACQDDG